MITLCFIQKRSLQKGCLTFFLSFLSFQFLFSQTTEAEKKEVYPSKYTFEKAYDFLSNNDYEKAVWFYINLFPEDKIRTVESLKLLKLKLRTTDVESLIKKSFELYGTFDPTVTTLSNGVAKIDSAKLKQKERWTDEIIQRLAGHVKPPDGRVYKYVYYFDQGLLSCDKSK